MTNIFSELKRRNIFRVAGAYAVVAWFTMQAIAVMTPALKLPDWVDSFFALLIIVGLPIALFIAWAFELTSEGIKPTEAVPEGESLRQETGRKLDIAIIIGLALVAMLLIGGLFRPNPSQAVTQSTAIKDTVPSPISDSSSTTNRPSNQSTSTQGISTQGTSIAVLPFVDMSATGDQEYFSDGMAEEILNALVKMPNLRVTGRTSSFAFKGKNMDMRDIGKALNVSHILEGSVRKQGERVRITAQLIQSADGSHLWSETYDGTLENIFDLQESVSRAIADELKVKLVIGENTRFAAALTENQDAYDKFLQARKLLNQHWGENTLERAIVLFREATVLDPNFEDAWAGLANANWVLPITHPVKDQTPYLKELEYAGRRALALNPSSSALVMLAMFELTHGRYVEGARLMQTFEDTHIETSQSYHWLGYYYSILGQTERALVSYNKSIALDPLNVISINTKADAYMQLGQFAKAETTAMQAYELGFAGAAFSIMRSRFMQDNQQGAIDIINEAYDDISYSMPSFPAMDRFILASKIAFGKNKVAQKRLLAELDKNMNSNYPPDIATLQFWRIIGESDKYIDTIDKYTSTIILNGLRTIWGIDEGGREIRQHPKFAKWANKVGLIQVWQDSGWPDRCNPKPGTDGSGGQFSCE